MGCSKRYPEIQSIVGQDYGIAINLQKVHAVVEHPLPRMHLVSIKVFL